MYCMRMPAVLLIIMICTPVYAMTEADKIHALLNALGSSKLVFIRNNTEYPAEKAKAHLEMKLSRAGARIRTAENFIRHLATRSSVTGEPYYVRFPDGTKVEAAVWLRGILVEIESPDHK